eukprot:760467-Hanusia_phi.AAC.6
MVVSHYSTFTAWAVATSNASALYAVSRYAWQRDCEEETAMFRDGDCFPLDSREPFSESGELFRGNAVGRLFDEQCARVLHRQAHVPGSAQLLFCSHSLAYSQSLTHSLTAAVQNSWSRPRQVHSRSSTQ